jgi:DNA-directed RNA polymerase subunit F
MTNPTIIEETPVSMAELKEELARIKKRDTTLGFRSEKTLEYLNEIHTVKEKESKEIKDKIEKLKIPRLKEEYIFKTIDLMPKSEEELRLILSAYPFTITKENLAAIYKIIEDYNQKKKKD